MTAERPDAATRHVTSIPALRRFRRACSAASRLMVNASIESRDGIVLDPDVIF
jgi:hypothetical protein